MASLQVRNAPESLDQRLRRYAQEYRCMLGDAVLMALERELARCEWHDQLGQRPTTDLGSLRHRYSSKSENGVSGIGRDPSQALVKLAPPRRVLAQSRARSRSMKSD